MVKQRKSTSRRVNKKSTSKSRRKTTKARPTADRDQRVRLNKYLADCGVCSRRKADELIDEGLIKVNGKTAYELGVKIDPKKDTVVYKGKPVRPPADFAYYAFYKPKKVVTTTSDPHGRPTILDFFHKSKRRLFPVGRLDWDAEGLLLVTDDGDFAQEVIHPSRAIVKVYHAKLAGLPTEEQLDKLRRGVSIQGGGKVAATFVKRLPKSTDKKAWIELGITEGKNHQVKKMFNKIGYDVVKLKRVSVGGLKLSGLKPGEIRELKAADLAKIFDLKKTIVKHK